MYNNFSRNIIVRNNVLLTPFHTPSYSFAGGIFIFAEKMKRKYMQEIILHNEEKAINYFPLQFQNQSLMNHLR